jgi:hypothetical protein
VDPLTLSLVVAWAIMRAFGETAWYGYQTVRQIPARRRRAIDVGYDPAAPETKPFTWERVFRRRAEGRNAVAAVCALGAIARGALSLVGAPFTLARQTREGWRAGWDEQRRRLDENEEWKTWWRDWKRWWLERPPPEPGTTKRAHFRRPDPDAPDPPKRRPNTGPPPSGGGAGGRRVVEGQVVDSSRPRTEQRRSGERPPVYVPPVGASSAPRPGPRWDVSVTIDLNRDRTPDREQRPHLGELPRPTRTVPSTPILAVIDRPTPAPTATAPATPAPALTEGDPDMAGEIATRTATAVAAAPANATATRGGAAAAPAPVAVKHEEAKRIGEAIVTRIASRLDEIAALKDHINSDMQWIAGQINDLDAAGIGGDLVALWLGALTDGDLVNQTAVALAGDIGTMHGSARDALFAQRATGDTMANAKAQAGEANVAKNTDYY